MALTRPKIWDIDTTISIFNDPITTLHQGSAQANVDVGFLFNRASGTVSNVALYWSESTNSFVTAFTSNTGQDGSQYGNIVTSGYANLTIGSLLTINGTAIQFASNAGILLNGSYGTSGQVLTASGTGGLAWAPPGTFSGGILPNQLVANSGAISTGINNGAFVVNGGAGISGNLYVGGNITSTSTAYTKISAVSVVLSQLMAKHTSVQKQVLGQVMTLSAFTLDHRAQVHKSCGLLCRTSAYCQPLLHQAPLLVRYK
jgi:hypothetical protein